MNIKKMILPIFITAFLFACTSTPKIQNLQNFEDESKGFIYGNIATHKSGTYLYFVNINDIPKDLEPYYLGGEVVGESNKENYLEASKNIPEFKYLIGRPSSSWFGSQEHTFFLSNIPLGTYIITKTYNYKIVQGGNNIAYTQGEYANFTKKGEKPDLIEVTKKGVYLGSYCLVEKTDKTKFIFSSKRHYKEIERDIGMCRKKAKLSREDIIQKLVDDLVDDKKKDIQGDFRNLLLGANELSS